MASERRLIFVYNAQSGLLSAAKDAAHKLLSPKTYPCSLCALTYGVLSMDRRWADFIQRLPIDVSFRYRDTATQWIAPDAPLPCLLEVEGEAVTTRLSAREIDRCEDLDALMAAVSEALAESSHSAHR